MKFVSRICLFIVLYGSLASIVNAQSIKSIQLEENSLLIKSVSPSVILPNSLPLISYQIGDRTFTTESNSSTIEISFSSSPYDYGIKGKILFKNKGKDAIQLKNVFPFKEATNSVYITGKGNHGLSRTHLFRPGHEPVNVIVPDNAWDLGFTSLDLPGDNLAALVRRDGKSLENGKLSRFETTLNPEGSITYNFWLDKYEGDWQEGLRLMFQKRFLYDVEVGEFDDSLIKRKDLQWIRSSYAVNLMMAWDNRFYDYRDQKYHVKEHLEKMKTLIGGYDVYGIWPTWPALGMDQRNQWDMFRDLPGGYKKLREISDLSHDLGSKFFICYNPWDESTRSTEGHLDGMTTITSTVNVDGIVLDTRGGSSKELQDAVDVARPGVVMYSEGMAVPFDMQGIPSGRVHNALYYPPFFNLNKFIKPDFAIFRVAEEHKEPIKREFNVSFFNGYGTEINSFSAGKFEWSDDQLYYWGKLLRIQRENSLNFIQTDYVPLIPTLKDGIYVNYWPSSEKKIYTVYGVKPEGFEGNLFEVEPEEGYHFVDLYSHEELTPSLVDGTYFLSVKLESFNISDLGTNNESSVTAIAKLPSLLQVDVVQDQMTFYANIGDKIKVWAGAPAYDKKPLEFGVQSKTIKLLDEFPNYEGKFVVQLFLDDELLDERVIMIKPGTPRLISKTNLTASATETPKGMVVIPAGNFSNDQYRTGDSFISYPESLTKKDGKVAMKKFYMDQYPVTNSQYKEFLDKTGYTPQDTTNFLKHWIDHKIPKGQENYPVIYVTLEDAQAYAKWVGKRLPSEMEWQYAAQTEDGNEWPWIQKTPVKRVEEVVNGTLSVWKLEGIEKDKCNLGNGELYPVGKYKKGVNPYGLYDLVGCVWQLTNDVYQNSSYRYIMVKGGSYFRPSSSFWYIQGGPRELNFRQFLLRVSPSFERKATVGFRCVKDAN
jgi:formylglycine-generating enzyme required for sulfatase activity